MYCGPERPQTIVISAREKEWGEFMGQCPCERWERIDYSEGLDKSIDSSSTVRDGQADYMDADADRWMDCGRECVWNFFRSGNHGHCLRERMRWGIWSLKTQTQVCMVSQEWIADKVWMTRSLVESSFQNWNAIMLKGSLTWSLKSLSVRTGSELERLSQELTLFRSERKDMVADR